MKRLALVGALAISLAVPAAAWQKPDPPKPEQAKPEQKPDTKAPASLAGKWDMSVQTDQGPIASSLDIKQDGKKLSGTIASERGTTTLEGEYAEGKITFWITMQGGSGEMSLTFAGAMKEDGSLAGTLDFGQGQLTWQATRSKAK